MADSPGPVVSPTVPVMVAMSGGVDSSVAAALLLEQGHPVVGVTLKTFCYGEIPGGPKSCCGLDGIDEARAVAARLGFDHFVIDVSDRFHDEVIRDFVEEYAAGRTPNPCVRCNATVKIPFLLEKALSMGCEALATGHYARLSTLPDGETALLRGTDRAKDQAYFLWDIPREVLPRLRLPLGGLEKKRVRELATRHGFRNAQKPESQEICFIPDGHYLDFLRLRLGRLHPGFQPGTIVDSAGKIFGRHDGFLGFTVGQRKGLGGGRGKRLYVLAIDPEKRKIVVGDEDRLFARSVELEGVRLMVPDLSQGSRVQIQIRHRSKPVPAILAKKGERWRFDLESPVRAVAPGQSGVLFDGDRLLGGGRIAGKGTPD